MPDELRFCAWGCCRLVNNRSVTKNGYELAARAYELDFNLSKPVETVIPCRKSADRLQYAMESALGFYLGLRLPPARGIPILNDNSALVFDHATGDFLRVATDEDIRRWNVARRQLSATVRGARDGIPSLLQIPFGGPKA
jgi:hypothetical protein